jgi:DNA (cytosine-5)-methyltransferase 1
MMENVPGLRDRQVFTEFRMELRELGYNVNWGVKDVRFYGVPQRRRRLILLAGAGFKIPFAPESTQFRTVRQTIHGLPKAGKSGDRLHDFQEARSTKVRSLIARIPKDGGSRLSLPKREQLQCHRDCDGFKDIYGRMAWDAVSPTITSGCFNPSKGRFLHPTENRCISMREAALLQSFPARFKVPEPITKTKIALMLGNALPPEFIRRHAKEIRRAVIAQYRQD